MGEAFRFLHTADLHLGSTFLGLRSRVPELARDLAEAPFAAWERIVDEALREAVDFVVISGDIFDAEAPSLSARLRFQAGLKRLAERQIPVFAIGGNHDPFPAAWSETVRYPENFHLFAADVPGEEIVQRNGQEIARVIGLSHGRLQETENLAGRFPKEHGARRTIALLHADIGAQPGSKPYAPAPLEELISRNGAVDYWALGHVHGFRILHESDPAVVYPGCPQGRSVHEPGKRGFALVAVDRTGRAKIEFKEAAALRFEILNFDALDGCTTFDQLTAQLREGAGRFIPAEGERGDKVLLRVILRGATPLNGELRKLGVEELFELFRMALAGCGGNVFLESVELETCGMYDAAALARSDDLAAEIAAAAAELRTEGTLRELLRKLRAGRYGIGDFSDEELDEIRSAAEMRLLDELTSGRGGGA